MSVSSNRNAVIGAVGWWYAKRMLRKRGSAALAGISSRQRLPFAARAHNRRSRRWLQLSAVIAAGGLLWWWRRRNDSVEP